MAAEGIGGKLCSTCRVELRKQLHCPLMKPKFPHLRLWKLKNLRQHYYPFDTSVIRSWLAFKALRPRSLRKKSLFVIRLVLSLLNSTESMLLYRKLSSSTVTEPLHHLHPQHTLRWRRHLVGCPVCWCCGTWLMGIVLQSFAIPVYSHCLMQSAKLPSVASKQCFIPNVL